MKVSVETISAIQRARFLLPSLVPPTNSSRMTPTMGRKVMIVRGCR
jgi:hypothetical protein